MNILNKPLVGSDRDEFINEVRVKLLFKKMSHEELGRRIGFATQTIHNNLSRNNVSKFVASAMAEELGIDISKYEKGEENGRTEE